MGLGVKDKIHRLERTTQLALPRQIQSQGGNWGKRRTWGICAWGAALFSGASCTRVLSGQLLWLLGGGKHECAKEDHVSISITPTLNSCQSHVLIFILEICIIAKQKMIGQKCCCCKYILYRINQIIIRKGYLWWY